LILDLGPEVRRVGRSSIMAIIDLGDSGGDHLPLDPGKPAFRRVHDLDIEPSRGLEHSRPGTLDTDDVENLSGSLQGVIVETLEKAGRLPRFYRPDPSHGTPPSDR